MWKRSGPRGREGRENSKSTNTKIGVWKGGSRKQWPGRNWTDKNKE